MEITVNGTIHPLSDSPTLAQLLDQLALTGKRVAVEVNGDIVPRGEHASRVLRDGDRVEIIHAIGGG
ncbi:MAG: sulfur carrier protein ThiS [Immundisolibacter sp.]